MSEWGTAALSKFCNLYYGISEILNLDNLKKKKKNINFYLKKLKYNVTINRNNQSHTFFFFRIDDDNSELAYCKICELNFTGTNKKAYAYTRKGGNTTSMINYLRERHNITRNNYTQYLDEHNEVKLNY